MPYDPRHGSARHQLDQSADETPDDGGRRRRRALEEDGTGGTRVLDLLNKHGKSGRTGANNHRRRGEVQEDEATRDEVSRPSATDAPQPGADIPRSGIADVTPLARRSRSRRAQQAAQQVEDSSGRHTTRPAARAVSAIQPVQTSNAHQLAESDVHSAAHSAGAPARSLSELQAAAAASSLAVDSVGAESLEAWEAPTPAELPATDSGFWTQSSTADSSSETGSHGLSTQDSGFHAPGQHGPERTRSERSGRHGLAGEAQQSAHSLVDGPSTGAPLNPPSQPHQLAQPQAPQGFHSPRGFDAPNGPASSGMAAPPQAPEAPSAGPGSTGVSASAVAPPTLHQHHPEPPPAPETQLIRRRRGSSRPNGAPSERMPMPPAPPQALQQPQHPQPPAPMPPEASGAMAPPAPPHAQPGQPARAPRRRTPPMPEPPAGFVDVTTEQPAIPAAPPQQLAPPPGAAEPTQVHPAIRPGVGFQDDSADQYGADQYDEFAYPQDWDENEWEGDSGFAGDNIDDRDPLAAPSFEGEETPADRTRAIDATLARFSAVHDQIKEEEEERRKRYAWILGKKKEPELGTDMPFDTEERDSGASRVEWKQQQKKKRTARMVQVIAGLVILVAVVTMALVAM